MRVFDWLDIAQSALIKASVDSPRVEAEMIAAHVLSIERHKLLVHPELEINEIAANALLERRVIGEPMAYVLSKKQFFGREFYVNRHVLIPRAETELVVEQALQNANDKTLCVDVGCGSGCVGLTLALEIPNAITVLVDNSPNALHVAQINAKRLCASVNFCLCDSLSVFRGRMVDMVVSNPPYVAPDSNMLEKQVRDWEPPSALYSKNGTDFIERLIFDASNVLKPHGTLIFEFGFGQKYSVAELLKDNYHFKIFKDLSGIERVAVAHLTKI